MKKLGLGVTLWALSAILLTANVSTAQIGINPLLPKDTVPQDPAPQDPNGSKADCIAQKDIQDIAKHFTQFANVAGKDLCNDNSQTWHLLSTIMFMKRTAFEPNMNNSRDELFTGRFASDWYQYFIGRIDQIEVVPQCEKGVGAYVWMFGGKTMYVCPLALTTAFTALDLASIFMHEARHIDGYPHTTCTRGPRAGIQGACDKKISDGGSYAVSVETYAQLAKYAKGLHPALKAYSRASAVVFADEAFETPVRIERTEKLMVLTDDLKFRTLDLQTQKLTDLGQSPFSGRLYKKAQLMILIPENRNENARFVFANNEGEISNIPGDMIEEYNAQTPAVKANLLDVFHGAQMTARLYKNKVTFTCDPKSKDTQDIQIPSVGAGNGAGNGAGSGPWASVAAGIIYPNGYDRAAMTGHFVMDSGEVFEMGCQSKRAYVRASSLRLDQKYSRLYKLGVGSTGGGIGGPVASASTYAVANGQLYAINANGSSALVNPAGALATSKVIDIAPYQNFNFFDGAGVAGAATTIK